MEYIHSQILNPNITNTHYKMASTLHKLRLKRIIGNKIQVNKLNRRNFAQFLGIIKAYWLKCRPQLLEINPIDGLQWANYFICSKNLNMVNKHIIQNGLELYVCYFIDNYIVHNK